MIPHTPENTFWMQKMYAAWKNNHPSYFHDEQMDLKPLRDMVIWIAKRNGIEITNAHHPNELAQDELVVTVGKIAAFVAQNNKYRLFSLDKINQFYRQEIMQQIVTPDNGQKKKMIL